MNKQTIGALVSLLSLCLCAPVALALDDSANDSKQALESLVKAPHSSQAAKAIDDLMHDQIAADAALPELVTCAQQLTGTSEDWSTRCKLAELFRRSGARSAPAVHVLTNWLEDPNWSVRYQSATALAAIGPSAISAVPALQASMGDKDSRVRQQVDLALFQIAGRHYTPRPATNSDPRPDPEIIVHGPATGKPNDMDFGPYMADLQRRIKKHWFPPKGFESKRVMVVFKVHSQGQLSDLRIDHGTGVEMADNAGLKAVEDAAPFRPLPQGAPESVDIQFTFDYNVFNGTGRGVYR